MSKWILITERMPKQDQDVLVCTASGLISIANWYDNPTFTTPRWVDNYGFEIQVKYWMYFPKKPEEFRNVEDL